MSFMKSLPKDIRYVVAACSAARPRSLICLDRSERYEIVLVSPRNYFLYTPLLPAVATGTCEERSIVEPVRNLIDGKVSKWRQVKQRSSDKILLVLHARMHPSDVLRASRHVPLVG